MPFIIDGHNLVPKAGFNLADIDVENDLVRELQEFSRIRQTSIEVYFDGGLPGFPTRRKFGNVTIFFIRKGRTSKDANKADEAIERRLLKLGKTARNWVVVSSDHRVITAAREAHARTLMKNYFMSRKEFMMVRRIFSSYSDYIDESNFIGINLDHIKFPMNFCIPMFQFG